MLAKKGDAPRDDLSIPPDSVIRPWPKENGEEKKYYTSRARRIHRTMAGTVVRYKIRPGQALPRVRSSSPAIRLIAAALGPGMRAQ